MQRSVDAIWGWARQGAAAVEAAEGDVKRSIDKMPLCWSMERAKEWFDDALGRVASLRQLLLNACIDELVAVAFDLEKVTPAYDHVVSDDRFVLNLAKKHLVQSATRKRHAELTIQVAAGAAWVSSHFVAWQLGEDILSDENVGERVTTANKILKQAQLAAKVVGAVALLADTQRPDREQKAAKYLSQKDNLPKALIAALEKV